MTLQILLVAMGVLLGRLLWDLGGRLWFRLQMWRYKRRAARSYGFVDLSAYDAWLKEIYPLPDFARLRRKEEDGQD
jgi:hypothetical protein